MSEVECLLYALELLSLNPELIKSKNQKGCFIPINYDKK